VSIHKLTEAIDGGPLVLQFRVAMHRPYSLEDLKQVEERITVVTVAAFINILASSQPTESIPQELWT
jgi:folate-dependent phosphoribosylglycinamide formyltransferase PurN